MLAQFLAEVDAMPEAELLKFLHGLVGDAIDQIPGATDKLNFLCVNRCLSDCKCLPKDPDNFTPCQHMINDLDRKVFCVDAQVIILQTVMHKDYAERPLKSQFTLKKEQRDSEFRKKLKKEIAVTNPRERAVVFKARAKRKDALRWPGIDVMQPGAVVSYNARDDRIDGHVQKHMNGALVHEIELQVHGQQTPSTDHPLSWLHNDARAQWLATQGIEVSF